jgi:membrane-bound serine protease (ClpP class)
MMDSPIVTAICLTLLLFIALLGVLAAASRHKKRSAGTLRLIGSMARVETDLEPEGAVMIRGELWRARVRPEAAPLRRGRLARVVGASGHLLEVERTE